MSSPKISLRLRLTLLLVALGLALTLLFVFAKPARNGWSLPTASTTTVAKQQKVSYGLPTRIIIPKINADAALDYVGITPSGELGVPNGPSNAAWYNLGPRPGEIGSAVIDGHYGWVNNTPAVFDNLHFLQKGDVLYVIDEKGKTITFIVRELRIYGQNDDHSNVFVSNDGTAHLNLITCQGNWNKGQQSYSNRLVVFSDIKII